MSTVPTLLLASAAIAQPVGHYDPDKVAAKSQAFVTAAAEMGPAFERAQTQLGALGQGLQQLEVGAALLGNRQPSGFDEWATAQRKTVTGQYLRVQRHVDLVQDDFGGVFSGALQRALESDGALLEECSKGSGVQALMRRQAAECPGDDRSGTLAAALDADKTLQTSVAEILAIPFPELGIEGRAWAPATITGTARWVSADALARRFASSALDRQTESLANRLAPLEARIAGGDAAAVEEAAVARAAYEAALAAMGDTVLGAAAPALQKAGMGDVGACANPTSFGGCTGADATREVLDVLSADRRFIKATDSL